MEIFKNRLLVILSLLAFAAPLTTLANPKASEVPSQLCIPKNSKVCILGRPNPQYFKFQVYREFPQDNLELLCENTIQSLKQELRKLNTYFGTHDVFKIQKFWYEQTSDPFDWYNENCTIEIVSTSEKFEFKDKMSEPKNGLSNQDWDLACLDQAKDIQSEPLNLALRYYKNHSWGQGLMCAIKYLKILRSY